MERRLAAILATDVVGYSRLIRADEEGTIAALKALRADLVDPKLDEHNGRKADAEAQPLLCLLIAISGSAALSTVRIDFPTDRR